MTKTRRRCFLLMLFCGAISVLVGFPVGWKLSGGPTDFQAVDFGARCLLQHHNPYNVSEMEAFYLAAGSESPSPTERQSKLVSLYVNLPTTFLIFAPFALLPLRAAQVLWMLLTAMGLVASAYLLWRLCEKNAPVVSACLIGFLLINCPYVFSTGNTAGLVVGLALVATWCFFQERFVLAGILCMAVSLAIKPHDGGLIWLYFLLAGGVHRKRALQTLAVTFVLGVVSVVWISQVAPSWWHDWQSNMATISMRGNFNDPGPTGVVADTFAKVISLQAVFSVFRDHPQFYNPATYLICVPLLLVWVITTLRSRSSREKDWLALAIIAPLTLIITYHRVYDAKLVMLTVPAFALLWTRRGPVRWIALTLTAAGIVLCSDIALILLEEFAQNLHLSVSALNGQVLTVLLDRTSPVVLFIVSIFYSFIYVRQAHFLGGPVEKEARVERCCRT
jgi:hypothetical protein